MGFVIAWQSRAAAVHQGAAAGGGVWNVSAARARRKLGKAQVTARVNGL